MWVDPWVQKIPWRRKWQPTRVYSCLETSMDRGVGHSPWVREESKLTEADLACTACVGGRTRFPLWGPLQGCLSFLVLTWQPDFPQTTHPREQGGN